MTERQQKIETAKKELNSYHDLFCKTRNLKQDLAELRERMSSVRITKYDDEPRGTAPNDSIEELFDKLHEIECKIAQNIWAMSDRQLQLVDKINKLTGVYADILHKRYIERKRFELITVELCYDYDYVRKLHSDALVAYFNKHFAKN
ncbi:MAG: hypothetical protein IJ999_00960 [Clostridia bacterium]|nr:hypothetical protein [Clostridia bacterium]